MSILYGIPGTQKVEWLRCHQIIQLTAGRQPQDDDDDDDDAVTYCSQAMRGGTSSVFSWSSDGQTKPAVSLAVVTSRSNDHTKDSSDIPNNNLD